jgi:hypothetical protein
MTRHVTVGPDVDLDAEKIVLPSGRRYTEADAAAAAEYCAGRPGRGPAAEGDAAASG